MQVCDVQGVDYSITDPCVHSKRKSYGAGDRGTQGELQSYAKTYQVVPTTAETCGAGRQIVLDARGVSATGIVL